MIYATVEEAQAAVEQWNAEHPHPQTVKFRFAHEPKPHRIGHTAGPAVVMGKSGMLALLELPGGIGLEFVEVVEPDLG